MIRAFSLSLIAVALLAVGCVPEAKVRWSPDGSRAAVMAKDGLYLCDAEGKLSARVAEGVQAVAWTPDSKRLAAIRTVVLPTWKDAKAFLDETQAAEVAGRAGLLKQELLAYKGPLDKFVPRCLSDMGGAEMELMVMYIRDEDPAGMAEKMGEKWDDMKKANASLRTIEVGDVADGTVKFQPPAARTLNVLTTLRLSPDGRYAACTGVPALGRAEGPSLWVVSLAGGPLREVADRVSPNPDWSPDGRFIVFARAASAKADGSENLRLGTISRRRVVDAAGAMPAEFENFENIEDLAGVMFHGTLKVRCLADDRAVFDSAAVQLPCTAADLPQRPELFVLSLKGPVTVGRIIPRATPATQPLGMTWFEISPDQKCVLVQTAEGVSVVALADGRIEATIAEKQEGLLDLPVWRGSEEICLAVPSTSKLGSPNRPEIVLWSPKGAKVLSKSWSDDMAKGMLLQQDQSGAKVEETKPSKGEPAPAPAAK